MRGKQGGRWRFLYECSAGFGKYFVFALAATVGAILFSFLTPQIVRVTVDSVIDSEPFALPGFLVRLLEACGGREALRRNLWVLALLSMGCAAFAGLFNFARRYNTYKAAESVAKRMRDSLFAHIQRLPFDWHMKNQTGDIIQRCTSDVETVRVFLASQMMELVRTVLLVVLAFVLMVKIHLGLSLLALAFMPFIALYTITFYQKFGNRFLVADEAEGKLTSVAQENLTGVRVVKAFGRESYELDKFRRQNDVFTNLWLKLGNLLSVFWGLGDFITAFQTMVILVASVWVVVGGGLTLGAALTFATYNSMLIWPVRNLGRILSEMSKSGVSLGRLKEIMDAREESPQPPREVDFGGEIRFEHVTFAYDGETPVLKDVSFSIPGGGTLGILGGTGSGKSTLMHLLTRLYDIRPDCGRITIGGVDIRDIDRDTLRRNIGLVLQEPFLFSRTIRENIAATRPGESMEAVRATARIASVDEEILSFADGYDTVVGERGVTLSGGQRQRVAIARTLMQDSPVMVFDDSLSAVDAGTDQKIRSALFASTGKKTVFIISHRITTLMHADHILVLQDGRVSEQGTHGELVEACGIYRKIYDMQRSVESSAAEGEEGAL
ncbi:ABC transporter ATP-binding protein [Feifania hominis]|uniref:ABC transporter ATP-binding protein n=1 Tax=Feifania hominis TaxID=2763660 RepID=A0A926DCJ8_9FIRM|nr:ABC transporter ATP-binding protein [Feifania hominis]MBC8535347.1 ABC transporter ATP-binding protein [Feifania hominis]